MIQPALMLRLSSIAQMCRPRTWILQNEVSILPRKEVIQPHLPIRLPSAITSDSDFTEASCSLRSELRVYLWDLLRLAASLPSVYTHCSTCVAQDIRGMMT